MAKFPDFDIAPVLEWLGADQPPHVRGSGYRKMLCPFHLDTKPSASVGQHTFRCFTCGVTGDAISLLVTEGGLTYKDAYTRAEELTGGESRDIPRASGWGGTLLDTTWN